MARKSLRRPQLARPYANRDLSPNNSQEGAPRPPPVAVCVAVGHEHLQLRECPLYPSKSRPTTRVSDCVSVSCATKCRALTPIWLAHYSLAASLVSTGLSARTSRQPVSYMCSAGMGEKSLGTFGRAGMLLAIAFYAYSTWHSSQSRSPRLLLLSGMVGALDSASIDWLAKRPGSVRCLYCMQR